MRDGRLEASGHNWVEGQGSGPRIDKKGEDDEDQYDAMGNKIDKAKKEKKLTEVMPYLQGSELEYPPWLWS